ncbi:MAG: hypothetical protein INH41_15290 [Myxococcaceae bacterium]|jgi:hypothetical protein|nr:hypothetical protein [Myxococcaceae bacterium]MCA3013743.1 hypothetical protein [Myxococcaceae bacterium]
MLCLAVSLAFAQAPAIEVERAAALMGLEAARCPSGSDAERVRCLLALHLGDDAAARALATALYERAGHVVGVLPEEDFDGGYRGVIHLVPQRPVGKERRHLEFAAGALDDLDAFLVDTEAKAGAALRYRWRALELRFFRSVKRRTPAAFASRWSISYNVNGTLNGSRPVVRHLLFHEVFHLNDDGWSQVALSEDYEALVARCGTAIACLTRYVPEPLVVKGGTYYSFMPGNGVREYAADLAVRYFREQREVMLGRSVKTPFKCQAPENARAWAKLVERFFGGVDRVPSCPRAPAP